MNHRDTMRIIKSLHVNIRIISLFSVYCVCLYVCCVFCVRRKKKRNIFVIISSFGVPNLNFVRAWDSFPNLTFKNQKEAIKNRILHRNMQMKIAIE